MSSRPKFSQGDLMIAVMGPTGAGKSSFIAMATGHSGIVGHGLVSYTPDIRTVRVPHPRERRPVVFVDTPGFDDTHRSDVEVLAMIADWLVTTYKQKIKLAGIIYLHRITDNRMSGASFKTLRMLSSLCGVEAMSSVILVTTMWDVVDESVARRREAELKASFWKEMLDSGCTTARFDHSYEAAWRIVSIVMQHSSGKTLRLQREMVDDGKPLKETAVHEVAREGLSGLKKILNWFSKR